MARPDKSRVSTDAAMRARDVSRPRDASTPDALLSENTEITSEPSELTEAGRRDSERDRRPQDPGGGAGSSLDSS